jgi:calcium-dependent protein kinase
MMKSLRDDYEPLKMDGDIERGKKATGWRLGHEQSTVEWWKKKGSGERVAIKFTKANPTEDEKLNKQCDRSKLCSFNAAPNLVLIQEKVWDMALRRYGLVFNYIPNVETLANKMERHGGPFSEDDARDIFQKIMQAVVPMHHIRSTPSISILHRRLTPANVLVTDDLKEVYVINWRNSKKDRDTSVPEPTESCDYTAPEFLEHQKLNEKVDVWSCGVLLYRMVCGKLPFTCETEGLPVRALTERLTNANFEFQPELHISAPCQELIRSMIKKDQADRITSKDALEHEWVDTVEEQTYDEPPSTDTPRCSVPIGCFLHPDEDAPPTDNVETFMSDDWMDISQEKEDECLAALLNEG